MCLSNKSQSSFSGGYFLASPECTCPNGFEKETRQVWSWQRRSRFQGKRLAGSRLTDATWRQWQERFR